MFTPIPSTRRPRRLSPGPLSAVALATLLATGAARAQVPIEMPAGTADGEAPIAAEGPPPRVWIEPRVFARQWYSDNFLLAPADRRAEWTTEVGASVLALFNTPRLKGSVDYSLSGLYQARGVGEQDHLQSLMADVLFDAWNNTAFIEMNGSIGRQRVSAFGVQPSGDFERPNLAETQQFRVSPFLRGTLANAYDYELRYSRLTSRTKADNRSDIDENSVSARIGSSALSAPRLGWTVDASRNNYEYSLGREVSLDHVVGQLNYALTPTLQLLLRGGSEANDVLTTERSSYSTWGAGFDWRPQPNMRLAASGNKRFFGHDHNLQFEYQLRRVVFRYTDARDVSANQIGLGDEQTTLAGLLNTVYGGTTDPVARARQVQNELDRLGLSGDLTTLPGYLTSFLTEQRLQEVAMVMLSGRGAFTFAIQRTRSQRLDNAASVGDDFDLSNEILQKGWTIGYAHRLSPRSAASIAFQRQQNEGIGSSLRNELDTVTLGFTTRLSTRTTAALMWRRALFDAPTPYRETAVQAMISHRF